MTFREQLLYRGQFPRSAATLTDPPDGPIDPPPVVNPDDGWEDVPVVGSDAGGTQIRGKNGGNAKVIFDFTAACPIENEKPYTLAYTADWSLLSNLGQDVTIGFGMYDTTTDEWFAIGLTGGGDTTLEVETMGLATDFSRKKPRTELTITAQGAATNGTLSGENYIQAEFNAAGDQITFRTSGDSGSTWDDEATVSLGTFTDNTEFDVFGLFLYMPNSDKGEFLATVTNFVCGAGGSDVPEPTFFGNVISLMQPDGAVTTDGGQQSVTDYGYYDNGSGNFVVNSSTYTWEETSPTPAIGSDAWLDCTAGAGFNPWIAQYATGGIEDPLPATGDFTMEFWVQFTTLDNNAMFLVNSWKESGTGARNWWLTVNPSTGAISFENGEYSPGISYNTIISSSFSVSTGVTYAIALERMGNLFSLYVDGTRLATATYSGSLQQGNTYPMGLGGGEEASKRLDGYIGPFRLCDEAIILSAETYTVRTTPFATSGDSILSSTDFAIRAAAGVDTHTFSDVSGAGNPMTLALTGVPTSDSIIGAFYTLTGSETKKSIVMKVTAADQDGNTDVMPCLYAYDSSVNNYFAVGIRPNNPAAFLRSRSSNGFSNAVGTQRAPTAARWSYAPYGPTYGSYWIGIEITTDDLVDIYMSTDGVVWDELKMAQTSGGVEGLINVADVDELGFGIYANTNTALPSITVSHVQVGVDLAASKASIVNPYDLRQYYFGVNDAYASDSRWSSDGVSLTFEADSGRNMNGVDWLLPRGHRDFTNLNVSFRVASVTGGYSSNVASTIGAVFQGSTGYYNLLGVDDLGSATVDFYNRWANNDLNDKGSFRSGTSTNSTNGLPVWVGISFASDGLRLYESADGVTWSVIGADPGGYDVTAFANFANEGIFALATLFGTAPGTVKIDNISWDTTF